MFILPFFRLKFICLMGLSLVGFFIPNLINAKIITPKIITPNIFSDGGGSHVGNGGDLIVCRDLANKDLVLKINVLDYYEGAVLRNWAVDEGSSEVMNKSIDENLNILFEKLKIMGEFRVAEYKLAAQEFFQNNRFVKNSLLTDVQDSDHSILPNGPGECKVEQLIIYKDNPSIGEKKYLINSDLWDKLNNFQRAGMVMHELIYKEFRSYGHTNSVMSRLLNSLVASNEIKNLYPVGDTVEIVKKQIAFLDQIQLPVLYWKNQIQFWLHYTEQNHIYFPCSDAGLYKDGCFYYRHDFNLNEINKSAVEFKGQFVGNLLSFNNDPLLIYYGRLGSNGTELYIDDITILGKPPEYKTIVLSKLNDLYSYSLYPTLNADVSKIEKYFTTTLNNQNLYFSHCKRYLDPFNGPIVSISEMKRWNFYIHNNLKYNEVEFDIHGNFVSGKEVNLINPSDVAKPDSIKNFKLSLDKESSRKYNISFEDDILPKNLSIINSYQMTITNKSNMEKYDARLISSELNRLYFNFETMIKLPKGTPLEITLKVTRKSDLFTTPEDTITFDKKGIQLWVP